MGGRTGARFLPALPPLLPVVSRRHPLPPAAARSRPLPPGLITAAGCACSAPLAVISCHSQWRSADCLPPVMDVRSRADRKPAEKTGTGRDWAGSGEPGRRRDQSRTARRPRPRRRPPSRPPIDTHRRRPRQLRAGAAAGATMGKQHWWIAVSGGRMGR